MARLLRITYNKGEYTCLLTKITNSYCIKMPDNGKGCDRISFLFEKYLNGTSSNDEVREIASVLEDTECDIALLQEACSQWHDLNAGLKDDMSPIESKLVLDQVLEQLHHRIRLEGEPEVKKKIVRKVFTIFSKIAALLFLPFLINPIYLISRTIKLSSPYANRLVLHATKTSSGLQSRRDYTSKPETL